MLWKSLGVHLHLHVKVSYAIIAVTLNLQSPLSYVLQCPQLCTESPYKPFYNIHRIPHSALTVPEGCVNIHLESVVLIEMSEYPKSSTQRTFSNKHLQTCSVMLSMSLKSPRSYTLAYTLVRFLFLKQLQRRNKQTRTHQMAMWHVVSESKIDEEI